MVNVRRSKLFQTQRFGRSGLWLRQQLRLLPSVLLIVILGTVAAASLDGQAIVKNEIETHRIRPVGFRIDAGIGPNGRRTVASINAVMIAFEAPFEDEGIAAGDEALADAGDATAVDGRDLHQAPRLRMIRGRAEELSGGVGSDFSNAAELGNVLNILLRDELEEVNAQCKLAPAQKKKLELAGRGDIKHFIDRAANVRVRLEEADNLLNEKQFRDWATAVGPECEHLGRLVNSGIFAGDSLFFKTLRTTLTPEQSALLTAAKLQAGQAPMVPPRQVPEQK
jgi:hypothetical protein